MRPCAIATEARHAAARHFSLRLEFPAGHGDPLNVILTLASLAKTRIEK